MDAISKEASRWVNFYWGYPYHRFLLEPVAVVAAAIQLLRYNRAAALILAAITIGLLASLTLLAGNKWPWYVAYLSPVVTILLAYPILRPAKRMWQRFVLSALSMLAILAGIGNHAAWYFRGDAAKTASYFETTTDAVPLVGRLFVRGSDTYPVLDRDRSLLTHWYFTNYDARALANQGTELTIIEHLERNNVKRILLNDNMRDYLANASRQGSLSQIKGLNEFLEALAPFEPTNRDMPESFVLQLQFHPRFEVSEVSRYVEHR